MRNFHANRFLGGNVRGISFGIGCVAIAAVSFFFRENIVALCTFGVGNLSYFMRPADDAVLRTENRFLKERIIKLQDQVAFYASLKDENDSLRKMLDIEKKHPLDLLVAFVLWKDPSSWRRIVVVNKGKRDGVVKDMLAVNESGFLIGKIIEAAETFSYVMLLSDPSFKIIAKVKDKPIEGVFRGTLSGGGSLSYVAEEIGIAEKDQLAVSESSMYPSGFLIGHVEKITKGKDFFNPKIEVRLAAHLSALKYIFIVKKVPDYLLPLAGAK